MLGGGNRTCDNIHFKTRPQNNSFGHQQSSTLEPEIFVTLLSASMINEGNYSYNFVCHIQHITICFRLTTDSLQTG
ncbi:hypothetical protein VIGAN_01467100 [Vigna angularis var. angularis]|uniref:Uncharacterized protein n=1 Tax=Vigna angularis var. angularis TaxID=157739 RepID=A0A0S3R8B3_PHAAN|nr:hypothetical protein VIGAN_01467100 [Vigna angularis var. angularis]